MSQDFIQVGKCSSGIAVKCQHLLKVTTEVHAVNQGDGQLTNLSFFIFDASGATR